MAKNGKSFKKGESGNPAGRPKGSENKTGTEVREVIKKFIDSKAGDLATWFEELEPKEKIMAFEKLLQYVCPRQKETEVNLEVNRDIFVERFFGHVENV